jgi:hypothetical protein
MKPSRFLKSSTPRSITTPAKLSFQEGRPLSPSDDEDEGQVARSIKCFAPNQEVFMIHASEDCEGLERVQLDDYDDYLIDPLDEDVDVIMDSESPANIKEEDADDIQNERRRLINARRTQRRHRTVETNQQGSGNLHDSSTGDLCAIINVGRDARNVIIARWQEREEVEAYSPTHNQLPLDYLETTQKRKLEAGGTIHP